MNDKQQILIYLLIKLLFSMLAISCIAAAAIISFYSEKLYASLDSLRAVKKLKHLTLAIIVLETIAIIWLTYRIGFSYPKSWIYFGGVVAADLIFVWDLFRWIRFLMAFKFPKKILCWCYVKQHRKYMDAGEYERANTIAEKALECESQIYGVWLQLANNYIFTKPDFERISQYLAAANEIINKDGNKNRDVAAYKMTQFFLSMKNEKLADAIDYLKQSLELHYSKRGKKMLMNLEKYASSQPV